MTAPPPLSIRLLGTPAVLVAGEPAPADVRWKKHLALLAYLALSPRKAHARAHLQTVLWPEKDSAHARHSLNEAVRRLRAGLGAGRVHSEGEAIALDERDLGVDVLAPDAEGSDAELLEGFTLPDAAAFDDWLRQERDALRRRRVARRLVDAQTALTAQRFAEALDHAHRALALDPLAGPVVAVAMRAAALQGDGTTALRLYHAFTDRLAADLGATPAPDLAALARRIGEASWRAPPRQRTPMPPLAGRADVHARVFELARSALSGDLAVLAITGGAGLGKSRLLDEIVDRWRLEGGTATIARPIERDQAVSWSTLADLFRRGLAAAPGLPASPPDALATLAAIVPGIPTASAPRAPRDVQEAGTSLRLLLSAVADEVPLALLIDDAELADGDTLAALDVALGGLATVPLLVVLASTFDSRAASELSRLMGRIGSSVPGTFVSLRPLAPADTQEVVDALAQWCVAPEQRARLARRLHFETGGNPLLLVTLLHGLNEVQSVRRDALEWPPPRETLEAAVPDGVPRLAQLVTIGRVRQLDASARAFLTAACVGSRVVDLDVTRSLAALEREEADRAVAELERRGFVSFDGAHYAFPAPLVARIVLHGLLTPGERHRLQERRAALLGGIDPTGGRPT